MDLGRDFLTVEFLFSLGSDSICVIIWKEQNIPNEPKNIRAKHRYKGDRIMVYVSIILNGAPTYTFIPVQRWKWYTERWGFWTFCEVLRISIGNTLFLMDYNARPNHTAPVADYHEGEGIQRTWWPAYSPDLNRTEHLWDAVGCRLRRSSSYLTLFKILKDYSECICIVTAGTSGQSDTQYGTSL